MWADEGGGYTEAPLPVVRMGRNRADARDRTSAFPVALVHIVVPGRARAPGSIRALHRFLGGTRVCRARVGDSFLFLFHPFFFPFLFSKSSVASQLLRLLPVAPSRCLAAGPRAPPMIRRSPRALPSTGAADRAQGACPSSPVASQSLLPSCCTVCTLCAFLMVY